MQENLNNEKTTPASCQTAVMGIVYLVFNANGHVIAVCSNYDKAEEIFRSEHGDFDSSVGIEEFRVDVKHCP
jgi:hypothetical protein